MQGMTVRGSNTTKGGPGSCLSTLVIRLICLIFAVILPCRLFSQATFLSQAISNSGITEIPIKKFFSSNEVLKPFDSINKIAGLSISADIKFSSDTALVRVILVDILNREYLVCESFPLISGSRDFSVDSAGEETMVLKNIVPAALRVELTDASVLLKEISLNTGTNKLETRKWQADQNSEKISNINRHIVETGGKWFAGETSVSVLTYEEKKQLFGGNVPNLQGFEYYKGGIFVMPGFRPEAYSIRKNDSLYVSEYSWRNRHGEDWVTPARNQGNCGSCWAFAATGATELLVNLYYNRHIDYDLAEQQLVSCIQGNCSGGSTGKGMAFIRDKGIVSESCFPYVAIDLNCSEICSSAPERINISHYTWFDPYNDDLKKLLLGRPVALSIGSWYHAVTLVGYKMLREGDRIYEKEESNDKWFEIGPGDPLIGQTAWLVKNSYGPLFGDNGYAYIILNMNNVINTYVLDGKVLSTIYDDRYILCEDRDDDGYYNWGVGPKPDQCPSCPDQPDGDNSDPCLGPMDAYGHMAPSIPLPPRAKNLTVDVGEPVPPLHASGKNVRWFADSALTVLAYEGNDFNTGKTAGMFTYYATQSSGGCESKAKQVNLVITVRPPLTSNTEICEGEKVILSAIGENIKWYEDSADVETDPRDGQAYNTIIIRDHKWMTENMNYAEEGSEYYLNDSITYHKYGRLYSWTAALEACPDGWNLAGDSQWKDLEKTLGMSQEEANKSGGYRGTTEGNKLKESGTAHWLISSGNTNESGLSVLPGGEGRNGFHDFSDAGTKAWFWTVTSTGRTSCAYARELSAGDTRIARIEVPKENGLSVRCIKGSNGLKQIAAGSDFMPGDTMPGIYNYYVSQEIAALESERKRVQLVILPRNFQPLPDSIDICAGMQLPALAAMNEEVRWYYDPRLIHPADPGNSNPGNYNYYVTRGNICATGIPEEVNVLIRQVPQLSLGRDTTLDWQEKVTFNFEAPDLRYEWNTGTTSPSLELQGIDLGSGKHTIWLMVTDTNNCTNTDTLEITVLYPTIVPAIEQDRNIMVYPNPGSGKYTVRLKNHEGEKISYALTDQSGNILMLKQIGHVRANEQFNLDISNLSNGIYFIRITGNNLRYFDKIIKTD
jgi:uncharacterized protein (TIGR02145 family)